MFLGRGGGGNCWLVGGGVINRELLYELGRLLSGKQTCLQTQTIGVRILLTSNLSFPKCTKKRV